MRLALDAELASGSIDDTALYPALNARGTRFGSRPTRPTRIVQRLRMKRQRIDGIRVMLEPAIRLRRDVLGVATGPPRILVRVDEFPVASDPPQSQTASARQFHSIMASAGVPYLMAIVPWPATSYLTPGTVGQRDLDADELELVKQLQADGVHIAQHGTTHRTRFANPRRHSEMSGLGDTELLSLLDEGRARLNDLGCDPRILVPPFNRIDPRQWATLASRYRVITGGPESVVLMGLQPTAVWRSEAVYLPCYPPLYGTAATILPAVNRLAEIAPATWVPIVLHVGWEARDGFASLRQLAKELSTFAAPWEDFLTAVERAAAG
jgi:hypothetical protein